MNQLPCGIVDTEISDPQERKHIARWLMHVPDAIQMVCSLLAVSHVWDDLIDGDVTPSESINEAFFTLAVGLSDNTFWAKHQAELKPLVRQGMLDWMDSNALLAEGNLAAAFVLRTSIISVLITSATLIGGYAHGRRVSLEAHRYVLDDFDDFVEEHTHGMGRRFGTTAEAEPARSSAGCPQCAAVERFG